MSLYTYQAKVVGVYDGDTVKVDIDQGFSDWKHDQVLRLYGVNTPELKGDSKEEGTKVRNFVRNWLGIRIPGRWGVPRQEPLEVTLVTHKDKGGKYGRWLASIIVTPAAIGSTPNDRFPGMGDVFNVNRALIEMGYPCPESWL